MSHTHKSLAQLIQLLDQGAVTSRELTEEYIKNIESKDGDIHAFVTTTFDVAREMADSSDSRRKNGETLSPLDGVPISVKDIICTDGIRSTASSKILENFIPPYDATVWKKLKAAGCVLIGKTNTDEFAMGSSTENSAFGTTKNPHDLTRVPGGTSGGATASVAADFCAAAVGTDTGGSIRQPAHFCGVTGLKVSYGRVSRYGVMPMASSLDSVGPVGKTAEDCAIMLQVMAGRDAKDSTTPDRDVPDYTAEIQKSLSGMTIGIPKEYLGDAIDQDTQQVFEAQKKILEDLGVTFQEISLPHTKYTIPTYYLIVPSEVSANMSRYDGIRYGGSGEAGKERSGEDYEAIIVKARTEGFGDEVKRRILLGTYALSAGYYDAYYRKAQKVRTLICQDFEKAFEQVDAILAPTAPTPAFRIGQNTNDPLQMYMEDILTVPASLAGICGLSYPAGKSKEGLPIGLQILGPAFEEARVLQVGHQVQKSQN